MNLRDAIAKLDQCERYFTAKEKDYELKNVVTFLLGFKEVHETIRKSKDEILIGRADYLMYSHFNLLASCYGMLDESATFFEDAKLALYKAGKLKNPISNRYINEDSEIEEHVS